MKRKNKTTYGLCIGGMIWLVIVANTLPQILFSIQDNYRMRNTKAEIRGSLDISQWNTSYEQNLNARINNFLSMREVAVTTIEHDFSNDDKLQQLVKEIFLQDWFAVLYHNIMITKDAYATAKEVTELNSLKIQDSKKYLVHGTNYQDGVVLMMWYLDLYYVPSEIRIQLLVDTETDTIYYLKITGEEESSYEEYKIDIYYCAENIPYYFEFYYSYYEADWDALFMKYGSYDKEKAWFIDREVGDDCKISFPLLYEESSGEFLFWIKPGEGGNLDITMGLSDIGEKIPEMMQN